VPRISASPNPAKAGGTITLSGAESTSTGTITSFAFSGPTNPSP
jgi:hypothetical protein